MGRGRVLQSGGEAELMAFMDAQLQTFHNFMTITTGNGPSHAAKVAYGQYVGALPTAFGSGPAQLPEPVLPAVTADDMFWRETLRRRQLDAF